MLKKISTLLILMILSLVNNLGAQHNRVNVRTEESSQRTPGQGQGNGNNTVAICHQTGNGNYITIYVAPAAVNAHLGHGDVLGACTQNNDDDDDNDDNDDSDDDNDDSDNDDDDNDNDDSDNDDDNDDNDDSDDNDNDDSDNDDDNDDNDDSDNDDDNDDVTDNDTTVTPVDSLPVAPAACVATEVINFTPGTTNDLLTPIDPARLITANALGTPEDSDATTSNYNFLTLGFGGEITLKFAYPIHNGEGNDVYVVETTQGANNIENCTRYPERIRAFGSQDGCNWVFLGEDCQNSYFDFKTLGWIQYLKLQDVSNISHPFGGIADGYDLDGVVCLHGEELNPVPAALSNQFATGVAGFTQGAMKNGNAVPSSRSNAANALGAPQGTDVVNFVSLGFGGQIILSFDYLVFDKTGTDITIVETSYGNPTCNNYPETARIEVSIDNINWFAVEGEACLDESIDVSSAGLAYFSYLRITDASATSSARFPGSADGFDVDGVIVDQPGCSAPAARFADNTSTPDEVTEITIAPNPFNSELSVNLTTSSTDEKFEITVVNTVGQTVSIETVTVNANNTSRYMINGSDLKAGTYLISVRSSNSNQTLRAVKL
jgi:hypothetical protein